MCTTINIIINYINLFYNNRDMEIYILRHEDRTMDASFFAPLTKEGLDKSIDLIKVLKKEKINKIYSSPFIRTMQTIHPYAKTIEKKINLEYSLSEIQHPHIIPEKSYQITLPLYLCESFNYNPKYVSMLHPKDHNYPEDEKSVETRVKKFLKKLVTDNINSDNIIILVTHQIVCNIILKMVSKDKKIDTSYNYMKGNLTKVFDVDKWVFQPVNWGL
jgi:broad specificity phosphatase PhoE